MRPFRREICVETLESKINMQITTHLIPGFVSAKANREQVYYANACFPRDVLCKAWNEPDFLFHFTPYINNMKKCC